MKKGKKQYIVSGIEYIVKRRKEIQEKNSVNWLGKKLQDWYLVFGF